MVSGSGSGAMAFFALQVAQLFYSADMPSIGKSRAKKNVYNLAHLIFAQKVNPQADDVTMIMLAGDAGGDFIVNQGGADAIDLVGGDGHADAAAIEKNAHVGPALGHRAGCGGGDVRVVAWFAALAAKIFHVMALGL